VDFGPSNCLLSGQQCLQVIRGWASVPRIVFFRPAVPSSYLRLGFGPSNCLLRASSAFKVFEPGLQSLESSLSSQQRFCFIQVRALVPRISVSGYRHSKYLNFGGNIPVRMPYVKYEGKSTVCNTRWPGIRIKRALPRNFPYLRYEVCTDGCIRCLTMNWASTW
jgi:hypothetical protein